MHIEKIVKNQDNGGGKQEYASDKVGDVDGLGAHY